MSIKTIKISPEAEKNVDDIIEVNLEMINYLKEQASRSPRDRYRLCLHRSNDHPVNEMVIVSNRSTYFRPHRHPKGKDESYFIMEGRMVVFIFDQEGNVINTVCCHLEAPSILAES